MLSYPFTSQVTHDDEGLPKYDRAVDSKFLRLVYAKYFSDGVFFKPTNSLQVVADTGMQVAVEPGTCHIQGAIGIEDKRRTLVVQASEEQDRIDTVVARLDLSLAVRSIDLYVVKGVAAESPQAPALTRDATTWEIGLANLFVAKNTQTISQQRITDTRLDTDRCGQVTQAPGDFDTAPYFAQLQAAIDQYNKDTAAQLAEIQAKAEAQLADQAADLTAWFGVKAEEFTGWFETVKGKLGEDPAGSLQNQVNALNAAVTGYPLKLTAGTNALQITAKRNSIESLAVEGFTKQPGSGDASPENVRAISVATKRMVKVVCDNTNIFSETELTNVVRIEVKIPSVTGYPVAYCESLPYKVDFAGEYIHFYVFATSIRLYISLSLVQFYGSVSNYLAKNPITVWYTPNDLSRATGIYLPIERTDESGYHCDCIELSADLCEGDKVETFVKSGCDKSVTLTGGSTESWQQNGNNGAYNLPIDNFPLASENLKAITNYLPKIPAEQTYAGQVGFSLINSARQLQVCFPGKVSPKSYLPAHPLKVHFQTSAYTVENDIPVQLESHIRVLKVFDGSESGWEQDTITSNQIQIAVPDAKSAQSPICDRYKGTASYDGDVIYINNAFTPMLQIKDSRFTDIDTAKSILAANPVAVVYELSAEAVYARDPVHIQTDDGATNVSTPEGCVLEIDVARNEAKEYAATLTNAGWQSSGSEYTQTAEVKCVEGLGFVSPESSFDGVIWVDQTEDLALNAELTEALGPVNTGYLTLGDGTITCRVAEKPARDIEIHFKAKR